eukprot:CAMPEP_0118640002 /NCGR_PEP_ID=MMETSP0785-20121206/4523_1 /TAXON_ID=91992 /ORGANISM="Bolidomonas pacifica, Strain CCMP 1866" /LENGTH=394 /DNA_ID=CAMNT_0006531365 /DNA_START=110 /DNA_END=1291 /DNA_ORIENTATION=+
MLAPSTTGTNSRDNKGKYLLVIPPGQKLRDEFCCPITRELISDPVIAADGHTYDRPSISKWLRSHSSSPKTGQPLDHQHLVPNHNLKRLITDMIEAGDKALYCPDESGDMDDEKQIKGPRVALVKENVLVCKCLGPVESTWNNKSFKVTEDGAQGGRRRPKEHTIADFIQFTDATVSRTHFSLTYNEESALFTLADLGSAGGTFVRIVKDDPIRVEKGTMFMLGKHQLRISGGDEVEGEEVKEDEGASVGEDEVEDLELDLNLEDGGKGEGEEKKGKENKKKYERRGTTVNTPQQFQQTEEDSDSSNVLPDATTTGSLASPSSAVSPPSGGGNQRHIFKVSKTTGNIAKLKCFAPEGTPIQGCVFPVTTNGVTMGRKTGNDVSFSQDMGEGKGG